VRISRARLWRLKPPFIFCGPDRSAEALRNPNANSRFLLRLLRSRNDKRFIRSGAPDVLLGVEGGEHYGLVVDFGGVLVDGGGGLGAEVAVARVEVESGDVVRAARAGELHAAFDASDGVEAFSQN